MTATGRQRIRWCLLGLTAVLVAVLARPYAGGWNDGSRLATVEALVDYRTFAIDASIYTQVHPQPNPYAPGDELLAAKGTQDKLYIRGQYYSDKSPVPAVVMAAVYQVYRWCGGPAASERPDWFALLMIWSFAGLPFVIAVWAVGQAMHHLRLPAVWRLLLTASFAFGNVALAYTQQVNSHILLLGIVALQGEVMVRPGPLTWRRCAWLGALAGFGYTVDLGTGPLFALGAGLWVVTQQPASWRRWFAFGLAAFPCVLLHHALNYAIAGTWSPANAHPEFFRWPGSPFNATNMTGGWTHSSLGAAVLYALDMLLGKKGFLLHVPPLLLAVVAVPWVARPHPERRALGALCLAAVGTWLLYAATSRNLSGMCLTVRWLLPLLVPGYWALAIVVRDCPSWRREAAFLMLMGGLLSIGMTLRGPWAGKMPPLYWPLVALTLSGWAVLAWRRRRALPRHPAPVLDYAH